MSIELLNKEHIATFKNCIDNAKSHVRIVSPFMGYETSKQLALSLKGSDIECTIITRFYREDFLNHASSLAGLKTLIDAGFKVYALKNLYSKLYMFDKELAILSEANFAMGGFRFNHELSFLIKEEDVFLEQLSNYYDQLLKKIKTSGNWLIDANRIENEIKLVDKLTKNRKDKNTRYNNITQFGKAFSKQGRMSEIDEIEKMMRANTDAHFDQGIWLNAIDTEIKKFNPDDKYAPIKITKSNKIISAFSQKPSDIVEGDYVYLSVISMDKSKITTPMIVARAKCKAYKADNLASEEDFQSYHWMKKYPYYVELEDLEILDTEISQCISHDRLIRELGSNLYLTTQGKGLRVAELKNRHAQTSHLALTPSAKQYIDKLFNDLVKNYGIVDISSQMQ